MFKYCRNACAKCRARCKIICQNKQCAVIIEGSGEIRSDKPIVRHFAQITNIYKNFKTVETSTNYYKILYCSGIKYSYQYLLHTIANNRQIINCKSTSFIKGESIFKSTSTITSHRN